MMTKKGRKFTVVIILAVLFVLCLGLGVFGVIKGYDMLFLAVTLPVLAGGIIAYLPVNVAHKKVSDK